jgi:hypothetical protein
MTDGSLKRFNFRSVSSLAWRPCVLADDIAAAAVSRDFHWRKTWNHFAEKIAKAERLVLRRDVVQTAQHLAASRPSSMRDTIEFARPIFPSCWIEWADADKREILELFGLRNMSGSVHPVRVGALITHHEGADGPGACTIEYAWTHGGPDGIFVCTVAAELALGSLPAEDLQDPQGSAHFIRWQRFW